MNADLSFLPGDLCIGRGDWRDYRHLARFHYLPKRPRNWSQIWTARYRAHGDVYRPIAVAVVSYPARFASGRHSALPMPGTLSGQLQFINRHVRTITRVIVHPQFRSLGLSRRLVQCICANCQTRYTEAIAQMGRVHPFFERGGMARCEPVHADAPIYYLYTRATDQKLELNVQLSTSDSER